MSNTPNVSLDSLDYSKFYETLVLQQGVPFLDSDFNEQVDLLALRRMMETRSKFGSCLFPATVGGARGFEVTGIPATIANADISAGYASVYGTTIQSSPDQTPLDFEYESDENYLTNGTLTGTSSGDTLIDDNKKFESWMSLVGCRVKMTSGTSSGSVFPITDVPSETSLECSGGIGSASTGDTYIIKPPALPASVGVQTTKEFQLWVFWEWINENQDPNIVNPGVAIETCERRVLRWVVRAEDTPYVSTPDVWTFSLRILPIASVTIETSDTTLYPVVNEELFADPTVGWTKPSTQTFLYETTLAADTEFNLPKYGDVNLKDPKYYYVGLGTSKATYRPFFELYDGSDPANLKPLIGSDGGPITTESIWIDGTTEVTDPSAQASSDGFLETADTDMLLKMDFSTTGDSNYTGDVVVKCYYRAVFASTNTSNYPENGIARGITANMVEAREYDGYDATTGIDVDISASILSLWLQNVGSEFGKRPTVYPSAQGISEDTWKLLHRLGNTASLNQAAVELWWNPRGEFITCQSCYPSTASPTTQFTVNAPSSTGTLDASIDGWIFDSGGSHLCYVRAQKYSVSDSAVLDPLDSSDWDYYTQEAQLTHETYRSGGLIAWQINSVVGFLEKAIFSDAAEFQDNMDLTSSFVGINDHRTGSTDRNLLYEWQAFTFGSVRIYTKGESSSLHLPYFEVAINCEWSNGSSEWIFNREGEADEAAQATLFRFSATRFDIFYQNTASIIGSRWDDTGANSWQTQVSPTIFTVSGQLGSKVYGNAVEYRRVAMGGRNVGAGSFSLQGAAAVNFSNNELQDINDSGSTIILSTDSETNWVTPPTLYNIDEYGFAVRGNSEVIAAGALAHWHGTATITVVPD
jgi:hypothetical protein